MALLNNYGQRSAKQERNKQKYFEVSLDDQKAIRSTALGQEHRCICVAQSNSPAITAPGVQSQSNCTLYSATDFSSRFISII